MLQIPISHLLHDHSFEFRVIYTAVLHQIYLNLLHPKMPILVQYPDYLDRLQDLATIDLIQGHLRLLDYMIAHVNHIFHIVYPIKLGFLVYQIHLPKMIHNFCFGLIQYMCYYSVLQILSLKKLEILQVAY